MNNQDLEFITKYINEDNISNKKIYNFLFQEYEKNLISYRNDINIWNLETLNIHNCTCGGSTIIMKRDLVNKAGYFPLKKFAEDWEYWKNLFKYSDCVFLREPLTYIDMKHGYGRNY